MSGAKRGGMQRTSYRGAQHRPGRVRRMSPRGVSMVQLPTQPNSSPPVQAFRMLTPDELACLRDWQTLAQSIGIDAVEDLKTRPWPGPVADTVIGLFRSGEQMANWLVIGQDGAWVVACCTDGTVSRQFESLAAALSTLHPLDALP